LLGWIGGERTTLTTTTANADTHSKTLTELRLEEDEEEDGEDDEEEDEEDLEELEDEETNGPEARRLRVSARPQAGLVPG
jgi:hypothetical protein